MIIAVAAGKFLNFNANFIVYVELQRERSKYRKTFKIKLLMLWKNLKVVEKALNCLLKKGTNPVVNKTELRVMT